MSKITVDDLLKNPFSERRKVEKIKIVTDEKPRPHLHSLSRDRHGIPIEFEFNKNIYDRIKWLTACEKRQEFFCWPCLLIGSQNQWSSGINDLGYIMEHYEKHEADAEHSDAAFKLEIFIDSNFESPDSILNPKAIVVLDSDRNVLIHLIKTICYGIRENRLNNCNMKKLNVNQCRAFLDMLQPKSDYAAIIDKLDKDPEIINGLVDAITTVLKAAIGSEIRDTTIASVILSEHILNKEESQISTVFRYLKEGKVYERFIGFTNSVGSKMKHKDVAQHFFNVKKCYRIRGKDLALSIDAAVLPCPELRKLFDLDTFQCKYFLPCYFHELGRVLIQSVTLLEECELFFRIIREIESYFKKDDNLSMLDSLLTGTVPHSKKKKWYSTCPFIVFLGFHRMHIVTFFEDVQLMKYVLPEDQARARTFQDFLVNFKTIFLLKTFGSIFKDHFDKNFNFSLNLFDVNFHKELTKFRKNIEVLRTNGFSKVWTEANSEHIGKEVEKSEIDSKDMKNYITLFETIINQVSMEINFRLKDLPKIEFCSILYCNNLRVLDFKEKLVKSLLFELEPYFHEAHLKNEIAVFKTIEKFKNKSIYDVIAMIRKHNLSHVFKNLLKLAEFTLALPFLPPSKDINFMEMKLKQIEQFSYIPEANGISSGDTSVLCIESELLMKLKNEERFYDEVIDKYCIMKRNGEFHQGYFS